MLSIDGKRASQDVFTDMLAVIRGPLSLRIREEIASRKKGTARFSPLAVIRKPLLLSITEDRSSCFSPHSHKEAIVAKHHRRQEQPFFTSQS